MESLCILPYNLLSIGSRAKCAYGQQLKCKWVKSLLAMRYQVVKQQNDSQDFLTQVTAMTMVSMVSSVTPLEVLQSY